MQHGRIRVALFGSHGESRKCRGCTGAQADSRAPGVRPEHPIVRSKARRCRSSATCCNWRRAHTQHRGPVRCRDGKSGRPGTRSREMNTQSNAMPESLDAQRVAPAVLSPSRPMYWSVRRELWENRSIYIAPLAVAGVFLFGFLISTIHLPSRMRALSALDPAQQREAIAMPFDIAAALLMLTQLLVGAFYCLDALHGERRDRSILFWKSLPVSDLTTVLSKASIPLVVLPLLTFTITVAMQLIMLLLSSAVLLGSGLNVAKLWTQLSFVQMSLLLLYHLMTVHALWPAPIYGWLLLVSGWARRATFLWAVLPLLAIGIFERVTFGTSHFASLVKYRLMSWAAQAFAFHPHNPQGNPTIDSLAQLTPGRYLSTPGLWIGLLFAAAFLFAAIRLRRYRGPI